LDCLKRQLGIKLVNLLDHHVDRLSWLAFLGTILMALRAFAADESSNKPPPTTLIIAAAADLKFALDDLVKEFEEKNSAIKVNVTYGSSGNFFAHLRTARRSICSSQERAQIFPTTGHINACS
jgi:Bacterial extracellular solute-binding protein